MSGGPFVNHVFNTFPGRLMSETDDQGHKVFYCTGLRTKLPRRPTITDNGTPEFKIRGISASGSSGRDDRSRNPPASHSPAQQEFVRGQPHERDERSRRSLPFTEEPHHSRSRSPPRYRAPARAPKGKRSSADRLLLREVLHFSYRMVLTTATVSQSANLRCRTSTQVLRKPSTVISSSTTRWRM